MHRNAPKCRGMSGCARNAQNEANSRDLSTAPDVAKGCERRAQPLRSTRNVAMPDQLHFVWKLRVSMAVHFSDRVAGAGVKAAGGDVDVLRLGAYRAASAGAGVVFDEREQRATHAAAAMRAIDAKVPQQRDACLGAVPVDV